MQPYRSDLRLLPNPIDLQKYQFVLRNRPRPTLIWLRAFHAIYNVPLAIRTLGLLSSSYQDSYLFLGGGDKGDGSFQETKQLVDALGLSKKVEFSGKIPNGDVPMWLQNGDIFINTTNVDNTPVSVLEAMACGLCIVSTNVGGIPYLLDHEHDALLVPPNSSEAMAAAVNRLLTEPGLSATLSEAARKKAEQFAWSKIFPTWNNLFDEILHPS
jgi:glycosyltransferase involved in cell wall biosynthesis